MRLMLAKTFIIILLQLIILRDDHFDVLGDSQTVQQGIEVARENVRWMLNNVDEIADWFDGLSTEAPPSTVLTTRPTGPEPETTTSIAPTTADAANNHYQFSTGLLMTTLLLTVGWLAF